MRETFDRVMSALLTVAALAIAAIVVVREFRPAVRPVAENSDKPQEVEQWDRILSTGRWIGDSSASIKIVEFGDLECPFCRTFHETIRNVRAKYGDDVALLYVHLPLRNHRFAQPAARAAECAYGFGRFPQLLDQIYLKQDSLGLKSWASFARDAGIADTGAIRACASDTVKVPMIEAGIALASALSISATPTVLVNGWRLPSPPTLSELSAAADSILSGRPPFSAVATR